MGGETRGKESRWPGSGGKERNTGMGGLREDRPGLSGRGTKDKRLRELDTVDQQRRERK